MTKQTLRMGLLAATLIAGAGGIAVAQVESSPYDPAQLPAFKGRVSQYDLTPRGDVDGLILDDGTEVHFPPPAGLQVVAAVKPGDAVTIHGLKARALPLVMAMSVSNDANSQVVIETGPGGPGGPEHGHGPAMEHHGMMMPPHPWERHGQMVEAQGVIKMQLHGPRAEMNGVLLADGSFVHLPPHEAAKLADMLKPGQTIVARGEGVSNTLGKSFEARAIGPSADKLTMIERPGHRPPPASGSGEPPRDAPGGPNVPAPAPAP